MPINGLETQITIVNDEVENNSIILQQSQGNQGSLANRLNQSINQDGSLNTTAIDDALHSIEQHTDNANFVRMQYQERVKLQQIANDATNLSISILTEDNHTNQWPTNNNILNIQPSSTITWRWQNNYLYADSVISSALVFNQYFNVTPISSDGINFTTTSLATPYQSGMLRVFVNGLRLTTNTPIGGYYYTEGTPSAGTFTLNTNLGSNIIRIDFNEPLS